MMRVLKIALLGLALLAAECLVGPNVQAGASRTFDGSSDQLTSSSTSTSSPLTFFAWVNL
ncbi:MAG: hypothetical protein GWN12_20405, partial [Thermoplasmata archaeon]|nr:hypothetical protein [Thermoplasmata archaeon]NIS14382.1 hypothetical protein [Thermoplasmata archaeon]NIW91068.1 hypothetical protein [Thermoplasmata archaeon]